MAKATKARRITKVDHVCQLLVVLPKTDPLVWLRIQVPEGYTFWDLHVAIQDAMGWKDYHLHEFIVVDSKTSRVKRIGIPDDEMSDERPCLAGWKVPIARFLTYGADPVRYRYDFGDDWEHVLEFEELLPADAGAYPRCVGGAGACPPEDVGGTTGYAEFLRTISDRRHPERAAMLRWAGGTFDPHAFEATAIVFDDPADRWKTAFQQRGIELSNTQLEPTRPPSCRGGRGSSGTSGCRSKAGSPGALCWSRESDRSPDPRLSLLLLLARGAAGAHTRAACRG